MRNGFNQLTVPYMNELTANQLNAASVFNGNTPVSFINYSLGTIGEFLQNPSQKRFCADKNGRVVDCNSPERVEGGSTSQQGGGTNNPSGGSPFPEILDELGKIVPCGVSTIWVLGGKQVPEGTPGAKPQTQMRTCDSLKNPVGDALDKAGLGFDSLGISTRIIIVFVGILLLVLALK